MLSSIRNGARMKRDKARYRQMNPILAELLQTGQAVSEAGKVHKIRSHITVDEGYFLEQIVSTVKPAVSLEVGLAYGVSTLFICKGLEAVQDPHHIIAMSRPGSLPSRSE